MGSAASRRLTSLKGPTHFWGFRHLVARGVRALSENMKRLLFIGAAVAALALPAHARLTT
jgi:hypothetical protein